MPEPFITELTLTVQTNDCIKDFLIKWVKRMAEIWMGEMRASWSENFFSELKVVLSPVCISPARTFVMTLRIQFTSWCISGAPAQGRGWEKPLFLLLPFLGIFQAEGQFEAESALQLHLRILRSGVERRMCLVSVRTMFENSFYLELLSAFLLIGNSWPVSQLRLNKLMKQGDVTSWRTTNRQQVDQIVCWS